MISKAGQRNRVVPGESLDPIPWSREGGERTVATQRQSILVTVGRTKGCACGLAHSGLSSLAGEKWILNYCMQNAVRSSSNMNTAQPTHANCKETLLSLKSEHSEKNQHRSRQRKQEERSKETGKTNSRWRRINRKMFLQSWINSD